MAWLERRGGRIYFERHGMAGPAVILVHGRGGCAASWWQQIPHLAADHRVLALDLRGFARSAWAEDGPHARAHGEDLLALLDAEGLDRAVVVGQSLGGRACMTLAWRHPERVRGLVLSATPGGLRIPEVLDSQAMRASIPRGIEAPTAALAPDYRASNPEMTLLYEQLRAMSPQPGAQFRASLDSIEDGPGPEDLTGHAVPTLVISGSEDPLYPPPILEAVAARIPGARFARMEGAGHSPYWEQPAAFNAHLGRFLAALA